MMFNIQDSPNPDNSFDVLFSIDTTITQPGSNEGLYGNDTRVIFNHSNAENEIKMPGRDPINSYKDITIPDIIKDYLNEMVENNTLTTDGYTIGKDDFVDNNNNTLIDFNNDLNF